MGRSSPAYPAEVYTYANVARLSVFYLVQRTLRAAGLTTNDGAPLLYARLASVVPPAVLRYDLGVPYLYEEPELLVATSFLGLSALLALLAVRLRRWDRRGFGG